MISLHETVQSFFILLKALFSKIVAFEMIKKLHFVIGAEGCSTPAGLAGQVRPHWSGNPPTHIATMFTKRALLKQNLLRQTIVLALE